MSFAGSVWIGASCGPPSITQHEAVQGRRPPAHLESISSPTNPFVKHCLKLRQSSKYRYSSASAIVVGLTAHQFSDNCTRYIVWGHHKKLASTFMEDYRAAYASLRLHVDGPYSVKEATLHSLNGDLLMESYFFQCMIGQTGEIFMFHGIKNEERDILDCLLLLDNVGIPTELVEAFDRVVNVSPGVMRKIAGVQSTESTKAAALLRIPTSFNDIDNNEDGFDFQMLFPTLNRLLVLDGIQDPGNLGTLLRTAMAFGWDGVFLLPGCCDPFNDKAIRASRGSCFQIPIVSGRWVHLESLRRRFKMKMLAGHPENSADKKTSFALSPEFTFLWEDKPLALVVGSEGHGLSEESKTVSELISIPMAGGYESLNVSVAGGIFLFMLQARKHRTC